MVPSLISVRSTQFLKKLLMKTKYYLMTTSDVGTFLLISCGRLNLILKVATRPTLQICYGAFKADTMRPGTPIFSAEPAQSLLKTKDATQRALLNDYRKVSRTTLGYIVLKGRRRLGRAISGLHLEERGSRQLRGIPP